MIARPVGDLMAALKAFCRLLARPGLSLSIWVTLPALSWPRMLCHRRLAIEAATI